VASSSLFPVAGEPLRAVALQLREEFSSFDRLMNDVFADVEQLRDQLQLKMAEVDDSRARLAERGRQLADQRKENGRLTHQLEQHEARLDAAIEELRLLRTQIEQERVTSAEREQRFQQATSEQLVLAHAERDRLLARIQELESRPPVVVTEGAGTSSESVSDESWLAVLSQLEAVREDVLSTRTQLADAVGRVSVAAADGSASPTSTQQFSELQTQLERLRQEQRSLEKSHDEVLRERDRLEGELELVRTRACELEEVVSEQQDQLAQQHEDVSDELRQLKSVIESQLSNIGRKSQVFERAAAPTPVPVTAPVAPSSSNATIPQSALSAEAPPADPVVNSVMAQFARLQKDVAQRRKKK
jgi:chromosome segregation ATPase